MNDSENIQTTSKKQQKFASHLFFFDEGYKGGSLYLNWLPGPGIDIGLRV